MLGGPFFLFNVSLFLTRPPSAWVDRLQQVSGSASKAIMRPTHHRSCRRSGKGIGRQLGSFDAVADSRALKATTIFRPSSSPTPRTAASIANASTGLFRCFQVLETEEQSLDSLKPVLMSHFRRLSKVHNIDYSEPVADEIIRLLGRYPGRAFTSSKRPEKAISFADKVGAMVRINVFAEPIELAELRDHMGALRDKLAVTRHNNGASASVMKTIEEKLVELRSGL